MRDSSVENKFYNGPFDANDTSAEVLAGLYHKPPMINPKFFYDDTGCDLFDKICQLPEYYITRTEIDLLVHYKSEIATLVGPKSVVIEPGSGSSKKIKILLQMLKPKSYIAIDISKSYLLKTAESFSKAYPWLKAKFICADIFKPISLETLSLPQSYKPIIFFPGSTIGNFTPEQSREFLTNWAKVINTRKGALLIGVDVKKSKAILESAYNDLSGVTAEFNLNILSVINHKYGANFNINKFSHRAFYNAEQGRIEMHLVSQVDQKIMVDNKSFIFHKGEMIHTENSYKYSIEEFQRLLETVGFKSLRVWQDPKKLFSLHYCEM